MVRTPRSARRSTETTNAGSGHPTSSMSSAHLLSVLYASHLRTDVGDPRSLANDRFVMSKGHGCMIQYVILEDHGVLSREDLDNYCKPNGRLGCHPDYGNPGIEASTGSLGHGLSMAVGMALAERGRKTDGMIYVVLSDGEHRRCTNLDLLERSTKQTR